MSDGVFARRGSERDYRDAIRAVMGGTATSSRAATIARTELATLYGRANLEAVRDLEAQSPGEEPLLLKVVEARDSRNHPLSRVIQGHIRHPSEPIKASVAAVTAEAAAMGWSHKRITRWLDASILWSKQGEYYEGEHHPGHYNDRGREVPWRERWGGKRTPSAQPANWPLSMPWPPPVNQGQQRKHIEGTNEWKTATDGGTKPRSKLTANPYELARHAGTGKSPNERKLGDEGYRERIDFGHVIGERYDEDEKDYRQTTTGLIHYRKGGSVHVVPAR